MYNDGRWKIYEKPRAFPRAWVVHQAIQAPSPEVVLERVTAGNSDLRRVAILSSPPPAGLGQEPSSAEDVRFQSYAANRIELNVTNERPGLLVLSEAEYPGWRATVNGHSIPILRVEDALRGIHRGIGPQRHRPRLCPCDTWEVSSAP